jgi:methylated-DNA-protein-cysteine methyltransferase related protein
MAKSSAFIEIKLGILEIAAKIPVGHVTTYSAIGEHLNVMTRHVAYILATLSLEEKLEFPWYRIVADKGAISASKLNSRYLAQIEHLKQEGVKFTAKNCVENFDELFCLPQQLVNWDRRDRQYLLDRANVE